MTQVMVDCADGWTRPQDDCVQVECGDWHLIGNTRLTYTGLRYPADECVVLSCDRRYAHQDDDEVVDLASGGFGLRDESTCIDGEWYDADDCCDCEVCGRTIHNDDSYGSPGDGSLCQSCMENHCSTCDRCEDRIWSDDLIYDEEADHYLCMNCNRRDRTLIKGYCDKTANRKESETKDLLRYGVELEVEH